MRFIKLAFAALAVFGIDTQFVQAESTTFVSGLGSDQNAGCTRTAPCKSFGAAVTATEQNGEIIVLDSGFFGGATITKSLTVTADGVTASASSYKFLINLPNATDAVVLKGLNFGGRRGSIEVPGDVGIVMAGRGKLTVVDCLIRNHPNVGIDVAGASGARVSIDRSTIVGNGIGIRVNGASNAANVAFIQRSFIDSNTTAGVQVQNASTVVISDSTISGSGGLDLAPLTGGTAISYGNNLIRSGSPTQTLPLK